MKPTLSQMQVWFREFNKSVFNNELPLVPIKFNNTRVQLGQFYWGRGRGVGIKISLFYDRTQEQYRNCLLHEMCHLYCYHKGWLHEGHGSRWKAIANKAYRITGLYIQRCENARDWKPAKGNEEKFKAVKAKKNAPAIIVDIDYGTYHFIVKTTKKVIWDASDGKEINAFSKGKVAGIYICSEPRAISWQNSRSLHRGYKFGFLEYANAIKPMLEKGVKVDNLRDLCWRGEYDNLGIR